MQIRKRSCREEYIATQVIESIADFTTKKSRKKLGASSKKDSICALLAWAFLFLSKSLKEIYGYYCLDIYWNWMKFVTNNKACCFVWTTHSVLTPIFELHMKDLFCCTRWQHHKDKELTKVVLDLGLQTSQKSKILYKAMTSPPPLE